MDQQLERDNDLVSRLEELDLPPGSIDLDGPGGSDAESSSSERTEIAGPSRRDCPSPPPDAGNAGCQPDPAQPTFNDVLSASRVYNRVQSREVDAASTILTTRSRAWSILSGISLAQVSVIAVIKLPLYESELRRFWSLACPGEILQLGATTASTSGDTESSPSPRAEPTSNNEAARQLTHPYAYKRLKKELEMLERGPHTFYSAGPIGEDLVCCLLLLPTCLIVSR